MRALLAFALVLVALAVSRPAHAVQDPALEWWTIETEHFRINYPHTLEPMAQRLARMCEDIHQRLSADLDFAPSDRTEILLTDNTDSANGSASPVPYNQIRLFTTAPGDISPLGDYDDWFLTLQTHEYTHTLHTGNISGAAAVINTIIGRQLAPNSAQPRWIIEGLAVVYESERTSAGRIRSSLFDMYLRADVIEDNLPGLDQMSANPRRWPNGNLWYLHGSRFLRWIADIYGLDALSAVSNDYGATLLPWGINRAIRRQTGRTYVELYDGWKSHLERHYGAQMAEVRARGLREGRRLTFHGRDVLYPAFVPSNAKTADGEQLVYFRDDATNRSGIYRLTLDDTGRGVVEDELVARTAGTSLGRFGPDGSLYFHSVEPYKNFYSRSDIFRLPPGETSTYGTESQRKRLTEALRANEADISPDGRSAVFIVNNAGTRFLEIADLTPEGAFENRRDLVPSRRYEQFFTPRFSPDGKRVAYSHWRKGGYRDIRIVDIKTGVITEVTDDRSLDLQPVWSPDGDELYFSSDRTGIFNIYVYDVASSGLKQVTNVRTGALCPAISADGKQLAYVGYTSLGHDLYLLELDPDQYLAALPPPNDRPDPPAEPVAVPYVKEKYNPFETLRPRAYGIELQNGIYNTNAVAFTVEATDLAGMHGFAAGVALEPDAPEPRISLDYVYGRLPVNLGIRFFRTTLPRGGYRINGEDIAFNEVSTGLTTSVSYPINEAFATQNIALGYSATLFEPELPISQDLDPYATTTALPSKGYMGIVNASYTFSNLEGALETAGPRRGVSLGVTADYADDVTGADYSLFIFQASGSVYVPMPWPGNHTMLVRGAGGLSRGNYPRRNLFFVGGPNLEGLSLLEVLQEGAFDTGFTLRGYEPSAYAGESFLQTTLEYRFPVLVPDAGLSTLPGYFRRLDGAFFVDYGGAFRKLDLEGIRLFHKGQLIASEDLHASVGGEIWTGWTVAHRADATFRIGYAYGLSREAVPNGQIYFLGGASL